MLLDTSANLQRETSMTGDEAVLYVHRPRQNPERFRFFFMYFDKAGVHTIMDIYMLGHLLAGDCVSKGACVETTT